MELPFKHSVTGTTIFTVMSSLAAAHNAINLSQGFPDFNIDERLGELLYEAGRGNYNQYAPMSGLPLLRQAIASDLGKRYQLAIDPDAAITVTPGATYGIYMALTALLRPGDEVILLEPAYDSYIPAIEMNGGKPVCIPLSAPDFHVDWDEVKRQVTSRTRAIIINTPHNPTGAVWNGDDWNALASIVRDTHIAIISDEVYEQVIFDGVLHQSVLQHEELHMRSFAIFSFGKVFNNTGWKIGYVVAPQDLTALFRHVHQYAGFSVNTPAQYAIGTYLSQQPLPDVGLLMENKRNYFLNLLQSLPFTVHKPAGGSYFQVVGYEAISDLPDLAFAEWLTREYGVATIPVSPFYKNRKDDRLIRFCFAKKEETLKAAADRLSALSI